MKHFSLLFLAFPFIASSCGEGTSVPNGDEDLTGRTFWSSRVTVDGVIRDLVDGTRIQITFLEGSVSVSAGCNGVGAGYTIDAEGRLIVDELAMTEIGCDAPRHAQDEFVVSALTSRPRVTVDGDTIVLSSDGGSGGPGFEVEFLDGTVADPDRAVVGSRWTVTGFITGEAAWSMAFEPAGWVEFVDESTLNGHDGCSEFALPAEYSDGSIGGPVDGDGEVQFGERLPEYSSEVCADNAEYADAFNALLAAGRASVFVEGTRMTIVAVDGNGVTFTALEAAGPTAS
ncbi:MAG: META domain-containing protein [Actinomycetota bacterium]|jgi:heat shock protein HslJ|nr:META domain-containing protein [Actinomycetota bacterium]